MVDWVAKGCACCTAKKNKEEYPVVLAGALKSQEVLDKEIATSKHVHAHTLTRSHTFTQHFITTTRRLSDTGLSDTDKAETRKYNSARQSQVDYSRDASKAQRDQKKSEDDAKAFDK